MQYPIKSVNLPTYTPHETTAVEVHFLIKTKDSNTDRLWLDYIMSCHVFLRNTLFPMSNSFFSKETKKKNKEHCVGEQTSFSTKMTQHEGVNASLHVTF